MSAPFLDYFYSAIFLPGITTQSALQREVQEVAHRLYTDRQSDLTALFSGNCPTLKQWTHLVGSMVIHPEEKDGGLVVSTPQTSRCRYSGCLADKDCHLYARADFHEA